MEPMTHDRAIDVVIAAAQKRARVAPSPEGHPGEVEEIDQAVDFLRDEQGGVKRLAQLALTNLEHLTTDDFAHGRDKPARNALAAIISGEDSDFAVAIGEHVLYADGSLGDH